MDSQAASSPLALSVALALFVAAVTGVVVTVQTDAPVATVVPVDPAPEEILKAVLRSAVNANDAFGLGTGSGDLDESLIKLLAPENATFEAVENDGDWEYCEAALDLGRDAVDCGDDAGGFRIEIRGANGVTERSFGPEVPFQGVASAAQWVFIKGDDGTRGVHLIVYAW